jgi:hypothetical protein
MTRDKFARAHAASTTKASGSTSPSLKVVPDSWSLTPASCGHLYDELDQMSEVEGLLLLHARGEIEPVQVEFLPAIIAPVARVVLADFAVIYGLRLWAGDKRPVPYGSEWVARRIERSRATVRRGLHGLVATGVLTFAGELPARGKGNGTRTYLPGGVR